MHYEDGTELIDPFAEVRAFCERQRALLEAGQREADEKSRAGEWRRKYKRRAIIAVVACGVLAGCGLTAFLMKSPMAGPPQQEETSSPVVVWC